MGDMWEDFEDESEVEDKHFSFGEYEGKKLICLKTDYDIKNKKYGFSFGQAKAKLIVKYYDKIKAFAEEE
jgi:uncharacterized protein (DUF3820 family)